MPARYAQLKLTKLRHGKGGQHSHHEPSVSKQHLASQLKLEWLQRIPNLASRRAHKPLWLRPQTQYILKGRHS